MPGDFTYSGLPDCRGVFIVGPTSLAFLVTGTGPTAAYTDWAYQAGLPADQQGAADDPDNDGLVNLLEFVLARDPLRTNVPGIIATTVVVDGQRFPAVTFVRRLDLGGVTFGVLTSADLAFASLLGVEQVSSTAIDVGLEQVVIRSLVPLAQRPNQFFRLAATLPIVPAETIVTSSPVGVMSRRMDRGLSGLAVPLISADHFVGVVASNTATSLAFSAADGSVGSLLAAAGKYYVEVVTGPLAGERFDVDTAATMASNDATLTVTLGPGSLSTLPVLTTDALAGARCVLRSHLTLSRLQQMLTPGLVGRDNLLLADGVDVLENGRVERYFLRADGVTWSKAGSTGDFRDKVLPPDNSFMLESKYAAQAWRHAGSVRTNPFRKNLVRGLQSFASGFPQDLSPVQIGALVNPGRSRGDALDGQQRVRVRRSDSGAPGRAEAVGVLLSARQRLDVAAARSAPPTSQTLRSSARRAWFSSAASMQTGRSAFRRRLCRRAGRRERGYSLRSATSGSTLLARCAGSSAASVATTANSAATPVKVAGSRGVRPNSMPRRERVTAAAACQAERDPQTGEGQSLAKHEPSTFAR